LESHTKMPKYVGRVSWFFIIAADIAGPVFANRANKYYELAIFTEPDKFGGIYLRSSTSFIQNLPAVFTAMTLSFNADLGS